MSNLQNPKRLLRAVCALLLACAVSLSAQRITLPRGPEIPPVPIRPEFAATNNGIRNRAIAGSISTSTLAIYKIIKKRRSHGLANKAHRSAD